MIKEFRFVVHTDRGELVEEPNKKRGVSHREKGWESGRAALFCGALS